MKRCSEYLSEIAHPEMDIYNVNLMSVRKQDKEQTDRYKGYLKLFGTNKQTTMESFINWRKMAHKLDISLK